MIKVSKKLIAAGLGALLVLGLTAVPNVAKAETKIGVVYMLRAIAECKDGKKARAELKRQDEKSQTEMKQLGNEINKLRAYLFDAQDMMKSEVRVQKQYELQKKIKQFNDMRDDRARELSAAERRLFDPIKRKMAELIKAVGSKGKYDMIIAAEGGVVYHPKSADITGEIISAYDAQYK